jgi:hypothetical protein
MTRIVSVYVLDVLYIGRMLILESRRTWFQIWVEQLQCGLCLGIARHGDTRVGYLWMR